jgi:hypothetical protein
VSRRSLVVLGLTVAAVAGYLSSVDRSRSDDTADLELLASLEARLGEIESQLMHVADYRAVLDNELQYTRGLDRHDEGLINASFWADAQASYGTLVSMDELAVWANESHAASAAHQHHVTTLTLDVDRDTAHEEGYILYSSDARRDTSFDSEGVPTPGRVVAGSFATLGTGRYVNRYERRDGEWRMIVHEYVHDISMPLEAVDLCARGCLGRWDSSDISYLRPLRPLSRRERAQRAEQGTMPRATAPSAPAGVSSEGEP